MFYKYIYRVQGFEEKLPDPKIHGNYIMFDMTEVTVYADSEEEAMQKAKLRINKSMYRIASITEYEDHTKIQEEQLKIQRRMVDGMNQEPKKPWEKE